MGVSCCKRYASPCNTNRRPERRPTPDASWDEGNSSRLPPVGVSRVFQFGFQ
jgi:hypothetical protein